ncbi:MAG: hypothetical protein AB7F28_06505 [Candidatus Margulisiibacteriota bacterium]
MRHFGIALMVALASSGWCLAQGSPFSALHNRLQDGAQAFVISNYPEEVVIPGIVFDEAFAQDARVFYYHKNGAPLPLDLQLTVTNPQSKPLWVTVNVGLAGPSPDGLYVGHKAAKAYLMDTKPQRILVPAFGTLSLAKTTLKPGQVCEGIVGVYAGQNPFRLSLAVVDPAVPYVATLLKDMAVPAYTFGRFSSATVESVTSFDCGDKLQEWGLGDEPFAVDVVRRLTLKGNYGFHYYYATQLTNTQALPRKVTLLYAPSAGMSRAVLCVNDKWIETKLFRPHNQDQPESVFEAILQPGESRWLTVFATPQGGGFYPVRFVLRAMAVSP